MQVQLKIFLVEPNFALPTRFCRQAVAGQSIVQRLMQIEFGYGIAIGIRLGPFNAFASQARRDAFMPLALPLLKVGEYLHQSLALHFRNRPGREPEPALAVLVEHSVLQQLLQ